MAERFAQSTDAELRRQKPFIKGFANRFADWLGPWLISKRGRYTVSVVTIIILGFSYYWSEKLIIGDAQVGSNLLYPDSRYNQDSVRINQNLPLINPLFVVVKGDKQRSLTNPQVMVDLKNFFRLHDETLRGCRFPEHCRSPHDHAPEIPRG